jgi:hypothetical protein
VVKTPAPTGFDACVIDTDDTDPESNVIVTAPLP